MQRTRPVAVGLTLSLFCSMAFAQDGNSQTRSNPRHSLVSFRQSDDPIENTEMAPSPFEPQYLTQSVAPQPIAPVQSNRLIAVSHPQTVSPSYATAVGVGCFADASGQAPRPRPLLNLMTDDPCGYDLWYCYWCTSAAAHARTHRYIHNNAPHGYCAPQSHGFGCNRTGGQECFVPRPYSPGPQPVCFSPSGYYPGPFAQPNSYSNTLPWGVPTTAQSPTGFLPR
jgi:hypothetical protein